MTCDLCKAFPLRTVTQLDADIEEGALSIDALAEKYYIGAPLVEDHIAHCVRPVPATGHELLDRMLREIHNAAADRKRDYEGNPEEQSHAMNHYINLMREAREVIMAMERIRPSEELTKEIFQKVISPIIRQCVIISVEEVNRLREEFVAILGPEQFVHVDKALKRTLRRIAARLKGDTEETIEQLPKILASDGRKRKDPSTVAELLSEVPDPVH